MPRFKKILLINPPGLEQSGYTPSPLGILYLATYLNTKVTGIQVSIVDGAQMGENTVRNKLLQFKPNLVGISSLTPSRHQAVHIAKITKDYFPHCKIVLGGIHATLMWKQMMEHYPEIDFIVRGEGEVTLTELVKGQGLSKINGLVWKKGKKIILNPDRHLINNLDKIPFPDRGFINSASYPTRGQGRVNGIDLEKEPPVPIIFSRGCMGACTFCSSWKIWKGYRLRSGKNVADEVEILYRKYQAKHISFQDDTLTGSKKEMTIFCHEIIKRKIKVAFFGVTRVDYIDKELLKIMRKAGFYKIGYGIETGSPKMLKKINKKTDLLKNIEAAKLTKKAGIQFYIFMLFGLPGETEEDRLLSDKLIKRMKPDEVGSLSIILILPGTILYQQAKTAKLINDDFWLGKRPYYIYRGGLDGDPVQRKLLLKDWYEYEVENTILGNLLKPLLILKRRYFNIWLYHLKHITKHYHQKLLL